MTSTDPPATTAAMKNESIRPGLFQVGRATWSANASEVTVTSRAATNTAIAKGRTELSANLPSAALTSATVNAQPSAT